MPKRPSPNFLLLILTGLWLALLPIPSNAQEKAQDEAARAEFIYRVNLGRADDVKLLLKQGASHNQLSGEGVPVICLAAGRSDPEALNIVKVLLEAGANINARSNKGETPIHYAAKIGNTEVLEFLLSKNADMYALDAKGNVARTAAFNAGQMESVHTFDNYILKQNADVNNQYNQRNLEMETIQKALNVPAVIKENLTSEEPESDFNTNATASDTSKIYPEITNVQNSTIQIATSSSDLSNATTKPVSTEPTEISENIKEQMNAFISDMAFNVCAFQYWTFCESIRQSSELDKEEMIIAITSSKNKAEKLKSILNKNYNIPDTTLDGILTTSQKRIFAELDEMPSNRDRHEKGVGKRDDMQQRCGLISRQWGAPMPSETAKSKKDGKRKGYRKVGGGRKVKIRSSGGKKHKKNDDEDIFNSDIDDEDIGSEDNSSDLNDSGITMIP